MTEASVSQWGRVDPDGTVYVRTSAGERVVGQWPGGDPAETLRLFRRRFEALELEVDLLERRVRERLLTPTEGKAGVERLRGLVRDAQAVGDLDSLADRLSQVEDLLRGWREERKAERARQLAAARERKELLAAEAEGIASGDDWRHGGDRLRKLLEEWKGLPRLERPADEELWRRFSTARTAYTRRRRQHLAEVSQQRERARAAKERLAEEAESLASSTEWGPTAARFRDLMRQWKSAGHAGRADEQRLWGRFRAAQDQFFSARDAVTAARDRELTANAERKEGLLAEAEALVPVRDPRSARTAFRDIAARWDRVGAVPKAQVKSLEGRFRKVEQAVRGADDDRRRRASPEAFARAETTVRQLESLIAGLEHQLAAARRAGDTARVQEAEEALLARRSWLEQARRTLEEFTPPASDGDRGAATG